MSVENSLDWAYDLPFNRQERAIILAILYATHDGINLFTVKRIAELSCYPQTSVRKTLRNFPLCRFVKFAGQSKGAFGGDAHYYELLHCWKDVNDETNKDTRYINFRTRAWIEL